MSLRYLFVNRERPPVFSRRFLVVWAKRLLNSKGLLQILYHRSRFAMLGGVVGDLSVLYGFRVNGRFSNIKIGSHTFVAKDVVLASHDRISIGDRVVINDGVKLLTASHSLRDPEWKMWAAPICIGDYAWVATDAIILPGVTIGKGAVVAAGAVVRTDVPDFSLAVGNPAVIKMQKRSAHLSYSPSAFCAPHEAWLGSARLKKRS